MTTEQQAAEQSQIRAYLLGALDEDRQAAIEQQLFEDDAFAARVRTAEDDLIEDFVNRRLAGTDVARFENNFLMGSRRKRHLASSR